MISRLYVNKLWCNNCGQNKNWTLYYSVVHHMFKSETFKYFEKGHKYSLSRLIVFTTQSRRETAERCICTILKILWSAQILLEKCPSWQPKISLTSEIRKTVEKIQIIRNLLKFQKFSFVTEKLKHFEKHRSGNLNIDLANSYIRRSMIKVEKKFHKKLNVLQGESMRRKKQRYAENLQM